jgi:thiamine transport system permease protein
LANVLALARRQSWRFVALGFIALFCFFPLFKVISLGFSHNWFGLLWSAKTASILWFTLWQAALSTLIVLLLAVPSAYAFYRLKFPGSRILAAIITVPFVLPSIVVAIAIKSIWNGNGVLAVIAANVFMNYGFAARVIGVRWQSADPGIEEAAQLDGASGLQRYLWIGIREIGPAISSAGLLTFLYCTTNFGLMLVLGGGRLHSLETTIYSATSELLNLPLASALVFLQCAVSVVLLFALRLHSTHTFGFDFASARQELKANQRPVTLVAIFTSLLVVVLPIAALIRKSLAAGAGWRFSRASNSLSISLEHAALNSLRNALVSCLIALSLGLFIVNRKNDRLLANLFRFPVGLSSVALGLGYLVTFSDGFFPLRNSWLITPIAQSIALIPLTIQIVAPAHHSVAAEFSEVAQSDGLDSWDFWWWIKRPLLRNSLFTALGYLAVVSVGEFGAANILTYGDQATLPTVLYQLLNKPGVINFQIALALSVLLVAFTAAVALSVDLLGSYAE